MEIQVSFDTSCGARLVGRRKCLAMNLPPHVLCTRFKNLQAAVVILGFSSAIFSPSAVPFERHKHILG